MAAAHDFVLVIPVADRPRQLAESLASLRQLRERYPYPGQVALLVVDDSLEAANQDRHRAVLADSGLDGHYLGQDEQRALVAGLPESLRARLRGLLGDPAGGFGHKGASVTRNLATLWLRRHAQGGRRLYWFFDSDQEFRVRVRGPEGEAEPYAVDYLNALDRLFAETPTRILTGKVVGDPPVSPAVMAGTLIDDAEAFLAELAGQAPDAPCGFHAPPVAASDAAYHDMADLFGFRAPSAPFRYRCDLAGAHDHRACLAGFAARLDRFFDGEHPTRRSYYEAGDPDPTPARTLYTGNYVLRGDALDTFIPFAELRLRMAGPTLGRLLRARWGAGFASANLPMLHRRAPVELGRSECRPGLDRHADTVDLSGEFERQYYGDVMLFSVEALALRGYPDTMPEADDLAAQVTAVETTLRDRYLARQADTARRIDTLAHRFESETAWWRWRAEDAPARAAMNRFLDHLRGNFGHGAPVWARLDAVRTARLAAIAGALAAYPDDRAAWAAALEAVA